MRLEEHTNAKEEGTLFSHEGARWIQLEVGIEYGHVHVRGRRELTGGMLAIYESLACVD